MDADKMLVLYTLYKRRDEAIPLQELYSELSYQIERTKFLQIIQDFHDEGVTERNVSNPKISQVGIARYLHNKDDISAPAADEPEVEQKIFTHLPDTPPSLYDMLKTSGRMRKYYENKSEKLKGELDMAKSIDEKHLHTPSVLSHWFIWFPITGAAFLLGFYFGNFKYDLDKTNMERKLHKTEEELASTKQDMESLRIDVQLNEDKLRRAIYNRDSVITSLRKIVESKMKK